MEHKPSFGSIITQISFFSKKKEKSLVVYELSSSKEGIRALVFARILCFL